MTEDDQSPTLRLDPDVLAALEATGPGWQALANTALRKAFIERVANDPGSGLDLFEIPAWVRPKPADK
ncbi:BrnA antitoxin family protein [Variovorax sp. UC122_21]|jgi:hypothetical protein|uniref:BrnA antitoxin family protein n=1 Tax=unclassified Variovorax TaxID=663243 RepID=UPI003757DEA4